MGKGMGRQRSRSSWANVIPHPHADPHGLAFANTRPVPVALVDKHFLTDKTTVTITQDVSHTERKEFVYVLRNGSDILILNPGYC
jgi:hypothetical protein